MTDFTADRVVVEIEARLEQYNRDINSGAGNTEAAMGRVTRSATEAEAASRSAFSSYAQQAMAAGKAVDQFTISDLRAAQSLGEMMVTMGQVANQARMVTTEELAAARAVGAFAQGFGTSATQVVGHSNRVGVSQQIMMHIVRGSTDQFAAGAPVLQIFTQHLGMMAEAAAYSGGALKGVAGFMAGGWGMALTVGITILATLIGSHHSAAEAAKHHSDAEKDLTKAVKELHDAMKNLNDSEGDTIQRHLDAARAVINRALAERMLTKALLERALAEEQQAQGGDVRAVAGGEGGFAFEPGYFQDNARTQTQIQQAVKAGTISQGDANKLLAGLSNTHALQALLDRVNGEILDAQTSLGETQIELARHIAEGQTDAMKGENDAFAANMRKLEDQARPLLKGWNAAIASAKPGTEAATKAAAGLATVTHNLAAEQVKLITAHNARLRQLQDEKRTDADADATSFRLPVNGPITGHFGDNRGARAGVARHQHAGLDIAVPVGTEVDAAAAGTVIEIGNLPGYGNVVIIDHGRGTTTRYGHLSKFLVAKGEQVTQGQVIGLSGGARGAPGSGDATGPHVHYEVRQGGRAVNPLAGRYATDPVAAHNTAERLARAAKEQQDRETARDQYFADTKTQLEAQIITARRKQVTSASENERLEEEGIEGERKKRELDYADLAKREKLTKAQAAILTAKSNELAAAQVASVEQQKQARLEKEATVRAEQQLRVSTAGIDNEREILQSADGLAKTQAERRRIELLLLDLQFEEMRLREQAIIDQAERVKASKTATDAEKQQAQVDEQIARARLETLGVLQAQEKVGVVQRTAGPLEQFRDSLHKTKGQIDEDLQQIAVNGITQLTDGLADAISGAKSLGDVFHAVAQQIIADLIRIVIQQIIVKTLMDAFGGGGISKSVGSSGLGTLKGFASGGRPPLGVPSLVGEHGPEIWMPDQPGTIIPMNKTASTGARGAVGIVRIEIGDGEMWEARVTHVAGNVAVETVRVAAPHITEMAVNETSRRLTRQGL